MSEQCESTRDADEVASFADKLGLPRPGHVDRVRLGGSLSAVRWGASKPRVVLFHGAGLTARAWDRALLHAGVDALALDLPGHGDSDRLALEQYRVAAMGDRVAGALREWGLADVAFVAHSMGSFIAARAAVALGGVRQFVILDATPHRLGSQDPTRVHEGTLDELVDAMHTRMPHRTRESLSRAVERATRELPGGRREWKWDPVFNDAVPLRAEEREEVWEAMARASARTTLLRGQRGGVTDDEAAQFLQRVPGANVAEVADAGHNIHSDQPAVIGEWIRQVSNS